VEGGEHLRKASIRRVGYLLLAAAAPNDRLQDIGRAVGILVAIQARGPEAGGAGELFKSVRRKGSLTERAPAALTYLRGNSVPPRFLRVLGMALSPGYWNKGSHWRQIVRVERAMGPGG